MRFKISKENLEHSLFLVEKAVGAKGIESHFVFIPQDGGVTLRTFGHRLLASTPLPGVVILEPSEQGFTIEAKRLYGSEGWLSAVDNEEEITFSFAEGEVTVSCSRGSVPFLSLDPLDFDVFDFSLLSSELRETAVLQEKDVEDLTQALSYLKEFTSKDENREAPLTVVECRGGRLFAAGSALGVVDLDSLEDSTLRLHNKAIPKVLSFLSKVEAPVSLLESDGLVVFRSGESFFGELRYTVSFPDLGEWDYPNIFEWRFSPVELLSALRFIMPCADRDKPYLYFGPIEDKTKIRVGVYRPNGRLESYNCDLLDHNMKAYEGEGFFVHSPSFLRVLGLYKDREEVILGITPHPEKAGQGLVRFDHDLNGLLCTSVVSWKIR